jgi:hypothetical protein
MSRKNEDDQEWRFKDSGDMYRHMFNVPSFTHTRNWEKHDWPNHSLAQTQVGNPININQNFATVLHAEYANSINSLIHANQKIPAIIPAVQLQGVIMQLTLMWIY